MTSKIRISFGSIELEYEGAEEFLKEDLLKLLEAVARIHAQAPAPLPAGGGHAGNQAQGISLTTNSIAAKLGCKSGPDLIRAACLRLRLQGGESFPRKAILDEMKGATAYYKKNYSPNLSKYLASVLNSKELLESAKDVYSFPAEVEAQLRAKLT